MGSNPAAPPYQRCKKNGTSSSLADARLKRGCARVFDLFLQLGIPYLDMDLLLGYSENENLSGWRESVVRELGQYIANTGRLFSKVADGNAPQ